MDNPLNHLNDEEKNDLIRRYKRNSNKDTVKLLKKDFRIAHVAKGLNTYFPEKFIDLECRHCSAPLFERHPARPNKDMIIQCMRCKHLESMECYCDNCKKEKKNNIEEKKREDIRKRDEYLNSLNTNVDFGSLSLKEYIYVGALLNGGFTDAFRTMPAIRNLILPLSPTYNFSCEIMCDLYKRSIIVPYSKEDPQVIYPLGQRAGLDHIGIRWTLTLVHQFDDFDIIVNNLLSPSLNKVYHRNELYRLWIKLSAEECFQFLKYKINTTFSYDIPHNSSVIQSFSKLLEHNSTSQIFYMINHATNNALIDFNKEKYTSHVAANTIISRLVEFLRNPIETQYFPWPKELPRSLLSSYFYNKVLAIGENGFTSIPSEEDISNPFLL